MTDPRLLELSRGIMAEAYPSLAGSKAMTVTTVAMADGIEASLSQTGATVDQAMSAMAPGHQNPVLPILAQLLAASKNAPCSDAGADAAASADQGVTSPSPSAEQQQQVDVIRSLIDELTAVIDSPIPGTPSPKGKLMNESDLARLAKALATAEVLQRIGERLTEPSSKEIGQYVHRQLMAKYRVSNRVEQQPPWSMNLDSRVFDSELRKNPRFASQEAKGIRLSQLNFSEPDPWGDKRFQVMNLVHIGMGLYGQGMGLGQSRADVVDFASSQVWEIKPIRNARQAVLQSWFHEKSFNVLSSTMVSDASKTLHLNLGGDWRGSDLCPFVPPDSAQLVVPIQVLSYLPGVLLYAVLGRKQLEDADKVVLTILTGMVASAKTDSKQAAAGSDQPSYGTGGTLVPARSTMGTAAIVLGMLALLALSGALLLRNPGLGVLGLGLASAATYMTPKVSKPGTQASTVPTPAPAAGAQPPNPPPPTPSAQPSDPQRQPLEQFRIGLGAPPPFGQFVIESRDSADASAALERILSAIGTYRAEFFASARRQLIGA